MTRIITTGQQNWRETVSLGRMGICATRKHHGDWIYNPRTREYERVTEEK